MNRIAVDLKSLQIARYAAPAVRSNISHQVFHNLDQRIKKNIGEPATATDGIVEAVEAGTFLNTCRVFVEEEAYRLSDMFSSYRWLWYLRRIPDEIFRGELVTTAGYDHALAEVITGASKASPSHYKEKGQIVFIVNQPIVRRVLEFCETVRYLSSIHQKLRWLGKNIKFRFESNERALPSPIPTAEEERAVQLYDNRIIDNAAFLNRIGTKGASIFEPSADIHINQTGLLLPAIYRALSPFRGSAMVRTYGEEHTKIEGYYRYILELINMSDLIALNNDPRMSGNRWWHTEAGPLLMLLYLCYHFLLNVRHFHLSIMRYGYFVMPYESITSLDDGYLKEVAEVSKRVLPEADFPLTVTDLLERLAHFQGNCYPLLPGPPIRFERNIVCIDMYTTFNRLDSALEYPRVSGDIRARTEHFEWAVQHIIETSAWAPGSDLLKVRAKHLKYAGQRVTDIDAIGAKGNTLLIVSCKSRIYSSEYDIGKHNVVREAQENLIKDIESWRDKVNFFRTHIRGDNYDFSLFHDIIGVVCTPFPIYISSDLGLEVRACGMRWAVTYRELQKWLQIS